MPAWLGRCDGDVGSRSGMPERLWYSESCSRGDTTTVRVTGSMAKSWRSSNVWMSAVAAGR